MRERNARNAGMTGTTGKADASRGTGRGIDPEDKHPLVISSRGLRGTDGIEAVGIRADMEGHFVPGMMNVARRSRRCLRCR
jgi:hypothetical protein